MRYMKTITVYEGKLRLYAEIIATEMKASVEEIDRLLTELFNRAKENGNVEDGKLTVCYYVEIDPFPDVHILEKALENTEYESIVLQENTYQQPHHTRKLHPYRKHGGHGKPNHWHRIRSNPRQR